MSYDTNKLKIKECYIENDNEITIYEYKNTIICENLYGEYEYTINDFWYSSLEKAIESIDEKEKYSNLAEKEKYFIDNYNKRKFCSKLDDLCPFYDKKECKGCSLYDAYLSLKERANNDRQLYNKIMQNN